MALKVVIDLGKDKEFWKKLQLLSGRALEAFDQGIKESAFLIQGKIKTLMARGKKSGTIYQKGKRGNIRHQASAPGQAPAVDTGSLINSIAVNFEGSHRAVIGSHLNYASFLEEGTSKLLPRPYLKPALEENKDDIQRIIKRVLRNALNS